MVNIPSFQIIKKQISLSSNSCGVYKMIGEKDKILYVGKARNLKSRLSSYLRYENLSERIKIMLLQVVDIKIFLTKNEIDALFLEAQLIKSLNPPYNIKLKDGKSYPYIVISKHDYPRIGIYRGKLKKNEFQYYCSFPSADVVKQIVLLLQKIFLLRGCSDLYFSSTKRPCLEYQIKRCSAPCVKKISKDDYNRLVKQAKNTLIGKNEKIKEKLFFIMKKYSNEKKYELASLYRDRINFLKQIQIQRIDFSFEKDVDFFNIIRMDNLACIGILSFRNKGNYGNKDYFIENCNDHSNDEILLTFIINSYDLSNIPPSRIYIPNFIKNKEMVKNIIYKISQKKIKVLYAKNKKENDLLKFIFDNSKYNLEQRITNYKNNFEKLEALSKFFSLSNVPKRIEAYDNSHTFGNQQVGVMIVAGQEGFLKKEYRIFNIKEKKNSDDYKMMIEILTRRFSGNIKNIVPDFLLIDGGYGHVSIVKSVLEKFKINIPFVCIAKGFNRKNDRFYISNEKEFILINENKVLFYLQSLRDEAHRFALESHKKKRDKEFFISPLNRIFGIGKKRKNALISHFGSIKNISKASINEIQNVSGISKKLAKSVIQYLNQKNKISD